MDGWMDGWVGRRDGWTTEGGSDETRWLTVAGRAGLVGHEHEAREEEGEEEEAQGCQEADVGEGEEEGLHGAHREALQAAADAVRPVVGWAGARGEEEGEDTG